MKSSLEQHEFSLSNTSEGKNKLQIKENNDSFNHLGKLAADHDVTVSNTMIKITYKKALKDQNSVENIINCNTDSDFANEKNKSSKAISLCNTDISFITKPPKPVAKGIKMYHSTSKQQTPDTERNKKYMNGPNVSNKLNYSEGSSAGKVQKPASQDGGSNPKKFKTILNKQTVKPELDKRFLKGNSLVKQESSIIQKCSRADGKKVKLSKGSHKKIRKLEKGVKKKTEEEKRTSRTEGVKRKSPNAEFNVLKLKINENKIKQPGGSLGQEEVNKSGSKKRIMLVDPDLPTGWTRFIRTKNKGTPNEQYVVYVVNPQGKKFRFKWKLRRYLQRTNSSLDVDQFFFGLYQRPKTIDRAKKNNTKTVPNDLNDDSEPSPDCDAENESSKNISSLFKMGDSKLGESAINHISNDSRGDPESENDIQEFADSSKLDLPNSPMYDDPHLPEGWKRFIKIRSCGESAGRMEVVIVSPEGRRHRTKKHLEHYLMQKQLGYKVDDFDFTVFGRSNRRPPSASTSEPYQEPDPEPSNDISFFGTKKKFDKPVPDLDINSLKESPVSLEGRLINTVTGLTLSCGISSARSERRQRLPRREHEKQLKTYLTTTDGSFDDCQIPVQWVQKLVRCRADFRILEADAALTVAEATKEFLKRVSHKALTNSGQGKKGLNYEDIAELVDAAEGLSFLKTLIPKKITFGQYIKLNRPKQFTSFT